MHKIVPLALGLSLLACGKSDPSPATKEAPKTTESTKESTNEKAKPPAVKPPPAKPALTIDPEIARLVKIVVANCQIDEAKFRVHSCKGGRDEIAVWDYASDKKVAGVYESLAELALTDGAKDKKTLVAITGPWRQLEDRELHAKASTPAAAERILKLLAIVPDSHVGFSGAAAIPLAAGKRTELLAVLDKMRPEAQLRDYALRLFLDWGGVAALPDLQGALASAKSKHCDGITNAVTVAVENNKNLAEADRTKMCDWSKSLAADLATPACGLTGAYQSLAACKGTYVDDVNASIEARLAAGKFDWTSVNGLMNLTAVTGPTPAQRERALATFKKASSQDNVSADTLSTVAGALGQIGRDAALKAKSKAILATLSASKHKEVADEAKRVVKDL